ncbi:MAG: hypothetical protein LBJ57_07480 [Prevotellaceae bacterium]|nr:hypothetical protein [Prevotellaceae bacterium]
MKVILSVVLAFAVNILNGQDRIITIQNDTIVCKILSISSTHINYEQADGQHVAGKFIPIAQVSEYNYARRPDSHERSSDKLAYAKRCQVGVQFGGAYLLASTLPAEQTLQGLGLPYNQVRSYYKDLKRGVHLSGEVYYMLNDYIGLGVRYLFFSSSAHIHAVMKLNQNPIPFYDLNLIERPSVMYFSDWDMTERMYVNYVAPSFTSQQWIGRRCKFRFKEEVSLGFVHYRDEARLNDYSFVSASVLATGSTLGGSVGASLEYYPVPWLSVGAGASVFTAMFSTLTISTYAETKTIDLDKENRENVSQVDYHIGVRFHF